MRYRPRSSVTTIFTNGVGKSVVSAITQTPASGPEGPVTVPARSSLSTAMAFEDVCRARVSLPTWAHRANPMAMTTLSGFFGISALTFTVR
jgi:hypothetical protein